MFNSDPHEQPECTSARRITLGELTSCADGKLVVAECMDTHQPRHIEDVANGQMCRCVCPGCRRRMVAHQGELRRHFQHAAESVDCRSAGESALHRFAKDVLAKALRLRLPELRAYHGDESLPVVAEQEFIFDSAVLEQRTGDIIPDVVCHKGGRSLHVEFKVTHACGPEKIDKLRAMDIGAIEIDLSGCPSPCSSCPDMESTPSRASLSDCAQGNAWAMPTFRHPSQKLPEPTGMKAYPKLRRFRYTEAREG